MTIYKMEKNISKMSTSLKSNSEVFTSPKTSDNPNSTPTQDVEDNIQEKDYMNDESPCLRSRGSETSPKGEISKPKKEKKKNQPVKLKTKKNSLRLKLRDKDQYYKT